MNDQQHSRADALTDSAINETAELYALDRTAAGGWVFDRLRLLEFVRDLLAVSPVEPPAAAPIDEPVAAWINYPVRTVDGEFAGYEKPELSFTRPAHGYDIAKAEPLYRRTALAPADERAAFDIEVGDVIADAGTRGIAWMAFKAGARYARAAASPAETGAKGAQEARVKALRDAIEGECDGLAIDDKQAASILSWLDSTSPNGILCSPALAAEAQTDWRELSRRLYVELFHCDQQMRSTRDEGGEPHWTQSTVVRDVLADAKAALDLPIGTPGALFAIQRGFGAQAAMAAEAAASPAPEGAEAEAEESAEREYFRRWENELPPLDGAAWDRAAPQSAQADALDEEAYVAKRMTETLATVYATIIGDDKVDDNDGLNAIERVVRAAQVLRLEVDLYRAQADAPAEAREPVETEQSIAADCYLWIAERIGTKDGYSVQEHVDAMCQVIDECADFFHDFVGADEGGNDEAVRIAKNIRALKAGTLQDVSPPADAGEAVGSVTISKPGDSATGISFMSLNEHGRQTLGKGKHLLCTNAKSLTLTVGGQQTIGRAADTLEFHGLKTEATELRALLDSTQQESKECTCPSGDGSLRQRCPVHPPTQTSADLADDDKRDAERYRTHVKYEYETIYMPAAEKKGLRPLAFAEYKASADQVADAARTQGSKS